jgi:hypothetical protein
VAHDAQTTLEIAGHLLEVEPPFSRNKHFEAHRDPEFKGALALYKRIKALAHDVHDARAKGHVVEIADGTYRGVAAKRIVITSPRTRRTPWLPLPAFTLLERRLRLLAER